MTTALVVEAAADLADELGFAALTPSELARRLDIRVASLYSHVAGADDLRVRVAGLALAESADLLDAAVAGRSGRDALRALADTYRDYARTHPGRYDAARLRLTAEQAAASAGPRHAATTRGVLAAYGLDPVDETHAVRLVGGLVHGFVRLELDGGFDHSSPPAAESWERAVDALDTTLTAWGS
ncbi:MAG: TetR family transcriptional regulator [Nocardioides sp.]|nr:TetR family transcriptional regulator [Nocardioides sp.]